MPQPVTARLESCGDGDGAGGAGDVVPEPAGLELAGFPGGVVPFDDEPEPGPVPPGDGEDEAPGEGLPLLAYAVPLAEYVMNVLIAGCEVPVRLGPEKQMTASSWLPPSGTAPADLIMAMVAWSVPLKAADVPFTTFEMVLVVVPSAWTSRKTAEPWNPDGHAVLVDQVGLPLVAPLAGFSVTAPGSVPRPARAAGATHTPSSTPPTTTTPASHPPIERPFLLLSKDFLLSAIKRDLPPSCSNKTREFGYPDDADTTIIRTNG
jgi:hypothetical protein